jgi:uncharacterized protein YggE
VKKALLVVGILLFISSTSFAQESGNRIYGNRGYYNQNHQPQTNTGNLATSSSRSYAIESSVLLNIKPDSFVVVFGLAQTAQTSQESNDKTNGIFAGFVKDLGKTGISQNDVFVDFITQTRVYNYKTTTVGQTTNAVQTFAGFETKKTIAIRYKTRDLFEKIVSTATNNSIFDLIKVDYIISDFDTIRAKLFEEAAKIIKAKREKYTALTGVSLLPVGLAMEKYDAFYPSERYQAYQAYETGSANRNYDTRGVTIEERKSLTFYYQPIEGELYDKLLNLVGVEPVVQYTLYLRMDCDVEQKNKNN